VPGKLILESPQVTSLVAVAVVVQAVVLTGCLLGGIIAARRVAIPPQPRQSVRVTLWMLEAVGLAASAVVGAAALRFAVQRSQVAHAAYAMDWRFNPEIDEPALNAGSSTVLGLRVWVTNPTPQTLRYDRVAVRILDAKSGALLLDLSMFDAPGVPPGETASIPIRLRCTFSTDWPRVWAAYKNGRLIAEVRGEYLPVLGLVARLRFQIGQASLSSDN